jgi:hypothetical protein
MRAMLPLLTIAFLAAPAAARDLRSYEDARFGIAAVVPADWQQQPPDARWYGARFVSPDGDAWLAIYAVSPAGNVDAHMETTAHGDGEDVTLIVRRPGWLVVSGWKGDRAFYRKAVLACGSTVWHHIALEYPARLNQAYDSLVSIVSRSLQPGGGDCR